MDWYNQNYLRDEDLAAILEAVEKRDQLDPEKADKFAYVAQVQEIAEENEFNLNIPRYIDTFDEEEIVELSEVSSKLVKLEQNIKKSNAYIALFCKELGIEAPFNE
tara:strand:- start:5045 stop:5362 length:318 start_codon:yes stop_codon:yes gene_type:complete